jgi:hypothetical protein
VQQIGEATVMLPIGRKPILRDEDLVTGLSSVPRIDVAQ